MTDNMNNLELEKWPDCPKWARASQAPGWLMISIYGGGLIWLFVELLFRGRIYELIEPNRLTGTIVVFGWGTLFSLLGIWLIITCRRARRIMRQITANNQSEE